MGKGLLVILVLFIFGVGGGYFWNSRTNASFGKLLPKPVIEIPNPFPSPTPFPFQEMTIPYLRSRSFEGKVLNQEKISENSEYTSYLATYDSDGLRVNGLLTIPKGTPPVGGWPAVVFVHGYIAPEIYKTRSNYVAYVDYLAKQELVVFKIDLRGHDNSEGVPSGAYYSGDYVIDTLNAYSALQKLEMVNPKRVGLWGHSMAGNVVFRSFVVRSGEPKIVIWAGAVYTYEDMREYSINDGSYRPPPTDSPRARKRQELRDTHGDFSTTSNFWRMVVPTNYLDGVEGKIQIHHAKDDGVVGIDYSRNLVEILKPYDIQAELFEYTSGGHNISGSSFTPAMSKTAEFLKSQ